MLVLTRKVGQQVVVTTKTGEDIVIDVCHVKGSYTKLGIKAPEDMKILRKEVFDRNAEQERQEYIEDGKDIPCGVDVLGSFTDQQLFGSGPIAADDA